jgi:outer membrane biogenesis lipoprotein LolB
MKVLFIVLATLSLVACGVETAGTAATAAALKKQEVEQGQKNLQQFQQKLDQATEQAQQRAEQAAGDK